MENVPEKSIFIYKNKNKNKYKNKKKHICYSNEIDFKHINEIYEYVKIYIHN